MADEDYQSNSESACRFTCARQSGPLFIREMIAEDIKYVAEIESSVFSEPWTQLGFLDAIERQETFYLTALWNGQICGYCGYYRALEEAEIVNVAVAAPFRRKKIGLSMLSMLLQEGKKQGVREFVLEVRAGNKAAVALYESLGFRTEGCRKNLYEKPREAGLIMKIVT